MVEAKKFLGRGAGDDTSGFEQDDTRGEEQGFAQIVGDEHDGFAEAAGQGAEFALELGAGDADALALAAGKLARTAMREFAGVEADKMEHFFDAGGDARGIPLFQNGNESDVFGNGEMGEETGVLDDVTDAATKADEIPIARGTILDEDFPLRGK